ncbi:DUF4914 family protein [Thermopirellula anaerolimosa]
MAVAFQSEIGNRIVGPPEVVRLLQEAARVILPETPQELIDLALGGADKDYNEVIFDIPGKGPVCEATVVRCRNGLAVNYTDPYLRRRDPDCMVVADDRPTDRPRFNERFSLPFSDVRNQILDWLAEQELIILPFYAGGRKLGFPAILVCPINAAFFAAGLSLLQESILAKDVPENFLPRAVVYVAPPFRHTLCDGKQVVIHNRAASMHEIFSLNLYPGPSAKKGVYGVLISLGEEEGWLTLHGSTVQVVTPYDNIMTLMHEGASGGGKSEMLEYPHREPDGRLLMGRNVLNGSERRITLNQGCELHPVTDDMALCHPSLQEDHTKLIVTDAETAWFVRVDHITAYGTDPHLERITTTPGSNLVFLNIHAVPKATCLIWEHTEDEPGKPCPNPRVILPRQMVPHVVNDPVAVDVRSFGVRTPPCTREKPTYGIIGMMHVLPPALAWLWRLVAPRGHANPSITDTAGLQSEGVGSYWPFATGCRVDQANLLLRQIMETPGTRFVLIPNQHIGAWKVGFMPQWLVREYLARRGGARFRPEQIRPARCPLLGYALSFMQVEGTQIPSWFLEVDTQPEVGPEAYDEGGRILHEFFVNHLREILESPGLDPVGRRVIRCCLDQGTVHDYEQFIPFNPYGG